MHDKENHAPIRKTLPMVTFFIEEHPNELREARDKRLRALLFERTLGGKSCVADILATLGWGISIATTPGCQNAETASILRRLIDRGIKITHWVVLPDDKGYWTNRSNLRETYEFTYAYFNWLVQSNLAFEHCGLDLELPIATVKYWFQGRRKEFLKNWARERYGKPSMEIGKFWEEMRQIGPEFEIYKFPALIDWAFSPRVRTPDWITRRIVMAYTDGFSPEIQGLSARVLSMGNDIPAFGILNGRYGETPGRSLGPGLPRHLTSQDLINVMQAVVRPEYYFFAFNGPAVLDILINVFKYLGYAVNL
jgi:hypothetical protein